MATFDYKEILQELKTNLEAVGISHIPEVTGATAAYLINSTERLQGLAEGGFDGDYIKSRLAEEGDILKAELASYEIFGQMLAQDAQSTTIQTIITNVLNVITALIINNAS